MLHNGLGTPRRHHAVAPSRWQPDVAPHILALLERAQRGDRDAFADLYLLTELPSSVQIVGAGYMR
jgi:hypothetical protein